MGISERTAVWRGYESVVLALFRRPERRIICVGAGFRFHADADRIWLVLCRHVIVVGRCAFGRQCIVDFVGGNSGAAVITKVLRAFSFYRFRYKHAISTAYALDRYRVALTFCPSPQSRGRIRMPSANSANPSSHLASK